MDSRPGPSGVDGANDHAFALEHRLRAAIGQECDRPRRVDGDRVLGTRAGWEAGNARMVAQHSLRARTCPICWWASARARDGSPRAAPSSEGFSGPLHVRTTTLRRSPPGYCSRTPSPEAFSCQRSRPWCPAWKFAAAIGRLGSAVQKGGLGPEDRWSRSS